MKQQGCQKGGSKERTQVNRELGDAYCWTGRGSSHALWQSTSCEAVSKRLHMPHNCLALSHVLWGGLACSCKLSGGVHGAGLPSMLISLWCLIGTHLSADIHFIEERWTLHAKSFKTCHAIQVMRCRLLLHVCFACMHILHANKTTSSPSQHLHYVICVIHVTIQMTRMLWACHVVTCHSCSTYSFVMPCQFSRLVCIKYTQTTNGMSAWVIPVPAAFKASVLSLQGKTGMTWRLTAQAACSSAGQSCYCSVLFLVRRLLVEPVVDVAIIRAHMYTYLYKGAFSVFNCT